MKKIDKTKSKESKELSRRNFIGKVGAATAGFMIVPRNVLGGKGYPKAKVYTDWREMLEKEKSIDAVVIGTPDHNHAPIAAAFMRQKKHVYVEKPLCKTITECRKLAELAKQYDVVTQMGNRGHATEGTRQTVEWV